MAAKKTTKPAAPAAGQDTTITITRPNLQIIEVPIVGTTPLIVHAWSEKAKKEMLDKQMKKAKGPKEAKNPEQQYRDSLYVMEGGGYGFPAVAFKAAAVRAAKMVEGLTMTDARQMFHVLADDGDLIRINGEPRMREDMVRLQGTTSDIRFRGEFPEWSATLRIRYLASAISAEQLVNLFELAGFSVGVGEWRTEKGGHFGSFTLVQ